MFKGWRLLSSFLSASIISSWESPSYCLVIWRGFLFCQAPAWEVKAAQKIDDLLESFLGIRDPDLGRSTLINIISQWQLPFTPYTQGRRGGGAGVGVEVTQQSFIWGGFALRSNPLPFIYHFWQNLNLGGWGTNPASDQSRTQTHRTVRLWIQGNDHSATLPPQSCIEFSETES